MYRKETPENRTIVQGFWSDLLDLWSVAFKDEGGENVSLKVTQAEPVSITLKISKSLERNEKLNEMILEELQLLNRQIAEAFDTDMVE